MTAPGTAPVDRLAAGTALVAIFLAGLGAVSLRSDATAVAAWWPAAGLSVALVALAPRRWWPSLLAGVVLATGAANLAGGREPLLAAWFGVANAAEALVAALVLRRGGDLPRLGHIDDFVRLVLAAVLGAAAVATTAAVGVLALTDAGASQTWLVVLAAHAAATLVVVPIVLAWQTSSSPRRVTETVLQSVVLATVTGLVFAPEHNLSLAFAPLPVLVWSALRLDLRVVTLQLLAVSAVATLLTHRGLGAFGSRVTGTSGVDAAAILVQVWVLSAAVMTLPLAVAVEQRRQLLAEMSLREERFRRNFTDSLTAMLLLEPRADRLEIVAANDAAVELLGRGRPVVGRYLDRVLDRPADVRRQLHEVVEGLADGWRSQAGLSGRPGVRVDVAVSRLSAGREPVYAAQLLDVTAEHEARTRIEAAERLTSATLDTAAAIILVSDMRGTLVRVNQSTCTLTGFAEDELIGRPVWARITPRERLGLVQELFAAPDGSNIPVTREADVACKDGGRLRVVWNNKLVRDEDGEPAYVVMTGIDVTAERRAAGLVNHLLRAAITTALVGIDARGRVTLFNSGAQRLLGHEARDVIGTPFLGLLDPDEVEQRTGVASTEDPFAALTAEIGPQGESRPRDWTWVGADGKRHTVSMTLSVATDPAAAERGFLCVGQDVTEQRQSQEMLIAALEKERTAVERLRKLDAAKNDFVSTVSHELRTPVSSIVGYTELLKDGSVVEPDAAQLPMLETITRNCERLIGLCDDLLTLGGLDAGAATWDRDRVDLTAVLGDVEESLQPLVEGRRLTVSFERPGGPVLVLGDRAQLERAVVNLLSNAVKFTEDGGSIGCRLERHEEEAWLVVHDTGIGIPVEEQPSLFQKFFRSSSAQDRAIPGTGLGLSIVAGIVASHGGRIGVDSTHLGGTTFTIRLPLVA